jgi:hypothetical protein
MAHELCLCLGVLTFTQTGEVLGADSALQTPLLGKPALPLAMTLLVAAPVVLLPGRELPRVLGPRLACRERFGNRQHGVSGVSVRFLRGLGADRGFRGRPARS